MLLNIDNVLLSEARKYPEIQGQVDRGNFTFSLSENRMWTSQLIRLLSFNQVEVLQDANVWTSPDEHAQNDREIFYLIWHHDGRRWRMGASMMGPDWTHWNGAVDAVMNKLGTMINDLETRRKLKMIDDKLNLLLEANISIDISD